MGAVVRGSTSATINRVCDRCARGYSFTCFLAYESTGTRSVKRALKEQIEWLSTDPVAIATHGAVCPHCQRISRAAQERYFPEGFVAGLRRLMRRSQRFGEALLLVLVLILGMAMIAGWVTFAYMPVEGAEDQRNLAMAWNAMWGVTVLLGLASGGVTVLLWRQRAVFLRLDSLIANARERDAELIIIDASRRGLHRGCPTIPGGRGWKWFISHEMISFLESPASERPRLLGERGRERE